MASRVLISDKLSPAAVAIFTERGVEVDVKPGLDKEELAKIIGDYDGLAIRSATKVTAKLLERASRLKVVGRAGIGVDNVDIPAATARGVIVMNTPFGNSITTAEHAIALMFALARQIPAADASTQAGKWEKNRFMGVELTGKTLGDHRLWKYRLDRRFARWSAPASAWKRIGLRHRQPPATAAAIPRGGNGGLQRAHRDAGHGEHPYPSFPDAAQGPGRRHGAEEVVHLHDGPERGAPDAEDAHHAALHGCVESIRSGVTTLVDFMYVHTQPGMIKSVVEAFDMTGMRGFVCRGFISDGVQYGVPRELIEEPGLPSGTQSEQMRRYNKPGGRVQVGVAPNMIWAVDEKGYRLTRKLADEEHALITTHVAETTFELQTAATSYGMNDTEFLSEIGFLGPDVLAAHCVHCKPHDIRILLHHETKVAHNPCSNMYLASGCPPIPEMLAAGVTVGLASDGPASSNNHSLFQAMKFAALLQKGVHQDATIITAEKVLEMATIGGARAVGLEAEIGSIEIGKKADIVVVDYNNAFMTPIHHPVSAMVYSALGHEVTTVMIDGRFVMRDGIVGSVDETSVRRQAQVSADALTQRAGTDSFKRRPWPGQ